MANDFNIGTVLGRLGSGLGTGIASYQTLGQPDYIFLPRYAGNGLASTTVINNAANKQRQLDQILGAGDYLSSMFGGYKNRLDFGDMKSKLSDIINQPMFNNLTSGRKLNYPLKTEQYKLPQIGDIGGYTVGDYGNEYNKGVYDYSLPTQYNNFKLPWE